MGKKNHKREKKSKKEKKKKKKKKHETTMKEQEKEKVTKTTTLEEVEAMSSDEEGAVDKNNKSLVEKAKALEKLIKEGAYDKIINEKANKDDNDDDDESIEEVVLDGDDIAEVKNDSKKQEGSDEEEEEEEEEEEGLSKGSGKNKTTKGVLEKPGKDGEDDSHEDKSDNEKGAEEEEARKSDDEEDLEEEEEEEKQQRIFDLNSRALLAKTEELLAEKKDFPWVEKFEVFPPTPLPFGTTDESTGMIIDVHDDLKREVAFYDIAMEAVEMARSKCKESGVPFSRPDDFFAEMVKSDDHMARVKDRLIFENKKIEAVAQRKSNREQKLRSKEAHANKIAEKSRRRKENLKAVDDWAHGAAANRGGGRYSDRDDQKYLKNLISSSSGGQKRPWTDRDGNLQTGPNKKRMAANKKYGYGGKRGRFKQNSAQSMNDMSGFNPRGNFGGLGTKKGPGGCGANRRGKRARDASRSRQRS